MNAVTLDVILQVVFGVTDEERLAVLRPKVNSMVNIDAKMLLAWSYPRLFATSAVAQLLQEPAGGRRASCTPRSPSVAQPTTSTDATTCCPACCGSATQRARAPLTDVEMRDQLVTLMLAGHETTASALSWTLHELGRHPEILAKALAAADNGDDAYLEACLKESMRVHPIIDFVARTLQSDQVVGRSAAAAGRHRHAVDHAVAQPRGELRRLRTCSTPSGSSSRRSRPTPGSRSVAAYAVASVPRSR